MDSSPHQARPPDSHNFPFDPAHGYSLEDLLAVEAPGEPAGFETFWRTRFEACAVHPASEVRDTGRRGNGWRVLDWTYRSTGNVLIHGWILEPETDHISRGLLIGHGYNGRTEPEFPDMPPGTLLAFYCARGLGRSRHPGISSDSWWHVLHDIHQRDRYVLGGCVEDVWMGVSALLHHYPDLEGRIGYIGESFGGGIGALAAPWDPRISRIQLTVPTFGHQPLRLELPSTGSAGSVRAFMRRHPEVVKTLAYFDAATAARRIRVPLHCACALFDPAVSPPSQFAIYNAHPGPKHLLVLSAGHFPHPGKTGEDARLQQEIYNFFSDM